MIALQNPDTAGSMFVPIVMGSDKTTVSVATASANSGPAIDHYIMVYSAVVP